MMHMILLNSKDSIKYYPNNKSLDFISQLAYPLNLEGKWEIAIIDYSFKFITPPRKSTIKIYCATCIDSNDNGYNRSVLRRVYINTNLIQYREFNTPLYIPTNVNHINSLGIYIRDEDGEITSLGLESFNCTLHLRKQNNV